MNAPPWPDLGVRTVSAAILAPVTLAALWCGGVPWALWLIALAFGLAVEWASLCGTRARVILGVLWVGPCFVSLLVLRAAPGGFANVLFVLLVVWAGDIGAYLVGPLLGGPRLAPSVSPGKTWSGAAGGLLAAILAGAAVGHTNPVLAGILAALLGIVAQAGDLFESAIKRQFGAKDSGWIIPGHGGLFDRLDGLLAAAPAAMLWSLAAPAPHLWQ